MTVHDVQVQKIGTAGLYLCDFIGQARKVRSQYRRSEGYAIRIQMRPPTQGRPPC
jgi:hypothetical protein